MKPLVNARNDYDPETCQDCGREVPTVAPEDRGSDVRCLECWEVAHPKLLEAQAA